MHYIPYVYLLFGFGNGMQNDGKIGTSLISGKTLKVLIMRVCHEGSIRMCNALVQSPYLFCSFPLTQ